MEDKRRFTRIVCYEKVLVVFGGVKIPAALMNISLDGALIEFQNDVAFGPDDIFEINLPLNNSNILLQFGTKVVHRRNNVAGVKFIHVDLDTMIHLRSFLEARSGNLEQVADEFAYLF